MNKRVLSFAIFASLLLASCGTADTGVTDTSAPSGDTSVSSPEAEYVSPGVDYGGAVFTILDYDNENYFWQAGTYSDIHADEASGEPINDAQYRRNIKVEEELNIDLQTHPVGGEKRNTTKAEYQKLVLSGDESIDAAFLFANEIKSILTEPGMSMDLQSISTLNTDASWWDASMVEAYRLGGKLRAITGDVSLYTTFAPVLYFGNKTMAENYKLDNVYDLVREGKWTLDVMEEHCRMVASDLNGDTKMDESDQYGMACHTGLIGNTLTGAGGRLSVTKLDGTVEIVLNNEKTVDIVERFVPFFNDRSVNIIADDYYSKYSNPFYEMHMPMFKNSQVLYNFNQLLIAFELRAMETDYSILPVPKYDEAQENYYTPMSPSWVTMLCVPPANNRLDMTGHVLDALGYYSQQYVTEEFIDTTVRYKSIRDEDSSEMLDIVLSNKSYDAADIYGWGGIGVVTLSKKKSTDFASYWASIEEKVYTELEATMEMMNAE
ncbi:MAG: hypothetical protein E7632_08630 [Ruminococcaceae bacterium]|nr:hypothetical protein [Oscillospiraceae bacterium]